MTVVGLTAIQRMVNLLITALAWDAADVNLFTAPSVILPNMVPADFTNATFDGYAPVALDDATHALGLNAAGDLVVIFPHAVFTPTGSTTPNTVLGWYVAGTVAGVGDVVISAGLYDEPISVVGPFTPVIVEAHFPWGQPQGN